MRYVSGRQWGMRCASGRQRGGEVCLGEATGRARCASWRQWGDAMCFVEATGRCGAGVPQGGNGEMRCASERQRGGMPFMHICYFPTATPGKDTSVLVWVVMVLGVAMVPGVPELESRGLSLRPGRPALV